MNGNRYPPAVLLGIALASILNASYAVDGDAVLGGAVGGAVGALVGSEIGGRSGAIVGGAAGAALGTAVATDRDDDRSSRTVIVEEPAYRGRGGPPPHALRARRGW